MLQYIHTEPKRAMVRYDLLVTINTRLNHLYLEYSNDDCEGFDLDDLEYDIREDITLAGYYGDDLTDKLTGRNRLYEDALKPFIAENSEYYDNMPDEPEVNIDIRDDDIIN